MRNRPSDLAFGSFLVYPSPVASPELARYKATVLGIKEDRVRSDGERWPEYAARQLAEALSGSMLEGFFDGEPWLVPLPRSGLPQKDSLWPAKRLAEALVGMGLGARLVCALERGRAVAKSAGSLTRPSPFEHQASFGSALPLAARRVILVDDVVTRGSTALGAAWRILEAMPDVEVELFALARTVPDAGVRGFVDVVRGRIEHGGGNWLERKL